MVLCESQAASIIGFEGTFWDLIWHEILFSCLIANLQNEDVKILTTSTFATSLNTSHNQSSDGFDEFFAKAFLDSLQDGYWIIGGGVGVTRMSPETNRDDDTDDGFYNFFKIDGTTKTTEGGKR